MCGEAPEEGGTLSKCVPPLELEDLLASSLMAPAFYLLICQVVIIVMFVLTTGQVILQVTCRSLNRTCLCKCSVGQWYIINESVIAEPENRFALLRMCWLLLAL